MSTTSRSSRAALALCLAASWLDVSRATTGAAAFQWGFNSTSSDLAQCSQMPLFLSSRNSTASALGVPPYYMIAFKPGGIATTSYIGTDPTNLSWQVNQPNGSQLLLAVADSVGNAGGEPAIFYTVTDGDSSCLPPSTNNNNLTLVANVSTSSPLETCQPLGLRVYGGTQPYNISIAALDSPVVTNVTLGADEDVLTWINRADPKGQVMASVSDANGWGTSVGMFTTAGSTNIDCPGLVTRSGNSTNVNQHPPQPSSSSKTHTAAIVGSVVPIVALLAIAAGVYWWWRRRRAARLAPEPAFMPDAWIGPVHHPGAELGYVHSGSGVNSGGNNSDLGEEYSPYGPTPLARDSKLARYRDDSRRTTSQGSASGFPFLGVGAGAYGSSVPGSPAWAGGAEVGGGGGGSDIVIQHRDAGGVGVTEVPPPYLDRGSVAGSSDVGGASSSGAGPSPSGPTSSNTAGPGPSNAYLNTAGTGPGSSNAAAGISSYASSSTNGKSEKSEKWLL